MPDAPDLSALHVADFIEEETYCVGLQPLEDPRAAILACAAALTPEQRSDPQGQLLAEFCRRYGYQPIPHDRVVIFNTDDVIEEFEKQANYPPVPRDVRVAVACTGSNGVPGFFFCVVRCMPAQYDNGDHYEAAKAAARDNDCEGPDMVAYDQHDGPSWLFRELYNPKYELVDISQEPD